MGEAVFVWAMFIITLYWASPYCRSGLNEQGRSPKTINILIMAVWFGAGGVWYWFIVQAGGNQMRYFFPFAMIGFIFTAPMAIQVWQYAKVQIRAMIMMICILPAINIACLLIQRESSCPLAKGDRSKYFRRNITCGRRSSPCFSGKCAKKKVEIRRDILFSRISPFRPKKILFTQGLRLQLLKMLAFLKGSYWR